MGPDRVRTFCLTLVVLVLAATAPGHADEREYALEYRLDFTRVPAEASVTVSQPEHLLRALSFADLPGRYGAVAGDGNVQRVDGRWHWQVPAAGGVLTWQVPINHRRGGGYDARRTDDWALFRGEDAFPAMTSRTLRGATSNARLTVKLPSDWSFVTALPRLDDEAYAVANPRRRFDRPTGWMLAGRKLGVRIETIGATTVLVAAPSGQNVRRQDMLAFMNWTLPALTRTLGQYSERLIIVSADDPFWRGGLSGPGSLYVHADRPLVSENGTSTLLHELFHVGFRRPGGADDDWIIEGLAEYYSIWLLRRSGTTTEKRFQKTLNELGRWAREANGLRGPRSRGPVTARAALLFHALNREIAAVTGNKRSLDHVVRRLLGGAGPITLDELRAAAEATIGSPARTISDVPYLRADDDQTSAESR